MEANLWPRRLDIISHESTLDLWELCDVNPAKIHVTVPKSARVRHAKPAMYEVHTRYLDASEITRFEGIPVVTPHRAILDGMERHLDRRLIGQAIDSAHRRGSWSALKSPRSRKPSGNRFSDQEQASAQRQRARRAALARCAHRLHRGVRRTSQTHLAPDVTIHGFWEAGYRALAEETAFDVGNVHDAADAVRQLIARIDKAW